MTRGLSDGTPLTPTQWRIIHRIDTLYAKAKALGYIRKPLAWALYKVWKEEDERGGKMKYKHPKKYKGIRSSENMQNVMRVWVEENCLKCSEFCGKEHDFSNCKPFENHCPQPIHYPPMEGAKDFVKMEVEE